MLSAALRAIEDVFSPQFRSVLWKSIGLTLLLFFPILVGVEVLFFLLAKLPWQWLETVVSIATALTMFAALFYLMAPVTALFAGFFLDEVAEVVEVRDYPGDRPGRPLATHKSVLISVQFGALVLLVNLALLPTLFFGIGAILMAIANAYFLGREYFNLIAMRHMPVREAQKMRKYHMARIFAAGFIPAGLSMIPVLNILVPLFSTSYFTHIFKKIQHEA